MRARRTLIAFGTVALAAALTCPGVAGAQEQPDDPATDAAVSGPYTLADAMGGEVRAVSATAVGGFGDGDTLDVTLTLQNRTDEPIEVVLPRGALFQSEDETEQMAVTAGPIDEDVELTAAGADPVVTVQPGEQEVALRGFCAQEGDSGPSDIVPMKYAGIASEPLPGVLETIAASDATDETAQEAVWWLTDEPTLPVSPEVEALLDGVDLEAFAADPQRVVLDERYQPLWRRAELGIDDEGLPVDGDGGSGITGSSGPDAGAVGGALTITLIVLALGGIGIFFLVRSPKRPATVRASASRPAAGWHPDPSDARRMRYWDGVRWTSETRDR